MLLLVKWADNDGIIMLMVVCTSVVKVVEFKACGILPWAHGLGMSYYVNFLEGLGGNGFDIKWRFCPISW